MENQLYLVNYYISEIDIKLNKKFTSNGEPISINPNFSRVIKKVDDNSAIVAIMVDIEKNNNKPFYGKVVIEGLFNCPNYEKSKDGKTLINNNASMILFPFLRQALASVTTMLNIPTYVIPVVNITELFEPEE